MKKIDRKNDFLDALVGMWLSLTKVNISSEPHQISKCKQTADLIAPCLQFSSPHTLWKLFLINQNSPASQKIHHPFRRRQSKKLIDKKPLWVAFLCLTKVNTCSEPLQLSICKQTADSAAVLIVPCLRFSPHLFLDWVKNQSYKLVKCETFIIIPKYITCFSVNLELPKWKKKILLCLYILAVSICRLFTKGICWHLFCIYRTYTF